jgi:branched-chain amino acid transport system substrate-binding protein
LTRLLPYLLILAWNLPFRAEAQNNQQTPEGQVPGNDPVTIGLLFTDHSYPVVIKAAERAIEVANATGGYMNREFRLVIRTAEGFWGAGSKESVSLVYEDHVCAMIGSLDGRNGHLAEQVAAKSQLTYIETYATEPTLSQAFVPWFMRVVPNDDQQSAIIVRQIKKDGGGKIAILSRETYDTRYAVRSLTKAVARETGKSPLLIEMDEASEQQRPVIDKILNNEIEHLVIPYHAAYLKDMITSLKRLNPALTIYGTLHFTMGEEKRGPEWIRYEHVYMIAPLFISERNSFLSDSRSAYMFDAVNLVINAIKQVGTDRQAITNYLSDSEYPGEATGSISFDEMGNRQSMPILVRIEKGIPHQVN